MAIDTPAVWSRSRTREAQPPTSPSRTPEVSGADEREEQIAERLWNEDVPKLRAWAEAAQTAGFSEWPTRYAEDLPVMLWLVEHYRKRALRAERWKV